MHDNYIKVSLDTKVYMYCTKTSKINNPPPVIFTKISTESMLYHVLNAEITLFQKYNR